MVRACDRFRINIGECNRNDGKSLSMKFANNTGMICGFHNSAFWRTIGAACAPFEAGG
jgi:hypothetical protein